MIIIYI